MRRNKAMSKCEDDNKAALVAQPLNLLRNKVVQSWHALVGEAWARKLSLAILAVLLLAIPRLITSSYWIRVIDQAGLYIIMALGLNVIVGYAGLLNLGYAAFFAIGAYTWALLASPQHDIHLPFLLIFPFAGALVAFVAYLLAIPALPLKGDYLALVTLAFAEGIRIFVNNSSFTNAAYGIIQIDHPNIAFFTVRTVTHYYYLILLLCAVEIFLMRRFERSRIGRAWMAIREDEAAARTMGLDTRRLKLLACAIGAAPAGLAGVLFAGMQTFISPESFKFVESMAILSMVIAGGAGNVSGVVLAALLLTILPEPLRGTYFERARILVYGVLLLFCALFRPQGIWPRRYGAHEGGKRVVAIEETSGQVEAR